MSEIYNRAELVEKIKDVDSAIDAVLIGQSYTINTGHGSQTVNRTSLRALREYRAELERRISRLESDGRPVSIETRRKDVHARDLYGRSSVR